MENAALDLGPNSDVEMENATVIQAESSTTTEQHVMSFHNITYTAEVLKMPCGPCRKKDKKRILHNVSGVMKPGLNAIMGPTGGGKSSLLDVLAKRKDPAWLTGKVLLDGKRLPKNFKYHSGYVVQSDLLIGTITVREALWFCANLRLPKSIPRDEKAKRIENILYELGLTKCADTKIGTELIRGISGGEKKRTSIALELILEPKILFLDEPTTGLDAATANYLIQLLKNLGDRGRTIVFSIHQPRYSIFKLFNSLTLLSQGSVVYHGRCEEALGFFERTGYVCEAHDNPADFLLDVLNGVHDRPKKADEDRVANSTRGVTNQNALTAKLKTAYEDSEPFQQMERELTKLDASVAPKDTTPGPTYATGFWQQLKVLLARTGKNMVRNPQALLSNLIMSAIIGIVFGLIYFQVDSTSTQGVQNRMGILFFISVNLMMGSLFVTDMFQAEKVIFHHEYVSGYYRVIAYFVSKVIADLIPLRTLAPMIFCVITYWMVGFKTDAASFFTFLLTAVLISYASISIGVFFASIFKREIGQTILIMTFIFTIIFSGLLVNVDSIMPWLSWLQYLSIARYGLVAVAVNEFWGQEFVTCTNATAATGQAPPNPSMNGTRQATVCATILGDDILYESLSVGNGVDPITSWDLWQNVVALGVITLGLFTLAYIRLSRMRIYS